MNDPEQSPISVEDLAQLFSQHMPHGRDIGMALDERTSDGRTRMRLPAQPFLSDDTNGDCFMPGVLFSLADSACGLAVLRALGRVVPIATLDMRIDHLVPASMDADLVAVAECYRMTSSIAFTRCELHSGPQSEVCAIAVGTFMLSSSSARVPDISLFAGVQPR
ncbi:MAG: PaaI family thioesterase [Gemmatimonadaceae bacterium]|nr:PaaI family thioesterase [Gemmatimonadaceae bacterium]